MPRRSARRSCSASVPSLAAKPWGGVPVSPWYLANADPLRLVLEKARAEARDRWAKLTLPQRREII